MSEGVPEGVPEGGGGLPYFHSKIKFYKAQLFRILVSLWHVVFVLSRVEFK